jgi:TolB-like protein
MPDIFLSYSREDQATARRFAEAFKREGLSVWWDQTLAAGEAYDEVTEKALREAQAVVVLWSKTSVASRWVRAEATIADRNGTLVPAMIEECTRPVMFELRQSSDLSEWRGESGDPAWQAFVTDVRRFVDRRASAIITDQVEQRARPAPGASAQPQDAVRRKPVVFAIAAAAVLVIGGAAWSLLRGGAGATTPTTIAVLPFVNSSGDPEQESFSDGLTEEILYELAQIPGLDVTGTSSFLFKGTKEDLRVIAGKLGVANLLEGSVHRDGRNLRIIARLVDGKSGRERWTRRYQEELQDNFSLQSKVAADVAGALKVKLDVGLIRQAEGGTTNVEAWERIIQLEPLLRTGDRADRARALQLAREAVGLDEEFSFGWYRLRSLLPAGPERAAAVAKVRELTPESWFARVMRIEELMGQRNWNWTELAALSDSIFSPGDPVNALTLDRNGTVYSVLMQLGRMREATQLMQRMYAVDPQSLAAGIYVQMGLYVDGKPDLAERQYQQNLTLPGNHAQAHLWKLLSLLRSSRPDQAAIETQLSTFRKSFEPDSGNGSLTKVVSVHRDPNAVRALLRDWYAQHDDNRVVSLELIAMLADAHGDEDLAIQALRRMIVDRGMRPGFLWWYPYSTELRADPQFKEIVRAVGLADYWRKSNNWGDFCKPKPTDNSDFECH